MAMWVGLVVREEFVRLWCVRSEEDEDCERTCACCVSRVDVWRLRESFVSLHLVLRVSLIRSGVSGPDCGSAVQYGFLIFSG